MVVSEEQLSQPVKEEVQVQEQVNTEDLAKKNYENLQNLVKQQQEQIEQLMKQNELTKKINQQLTETNQQLVEKKQDNKHWVDKQLENFQFDSTFDPRQMYFQKGGTEQLATWYLQYLKSQGCTNSEISYRMNNIFKTMEGEAQVHEDIN